MTALRALRASVAAAAVAASLVCLAGCADPVMVGRPVPGPSGPRTCPPPQQWLATGPAPTELQSTPANTPQAEALSQAVGAQGRGAFADVYGSQITDYPVGRVALCVTDLNRGAQLATAAKRAEPGIDLSRLDLYLCRYSERTLDRAVQRGMAHPRLLGFPLYTGSPVQDASGVEFTTTPAGARSAALRAALAEAVGGGIPVTVLPGEAAQS